MYSVSRNKESFGNVAVGRWKVEVKGGQGLSRYPQQRKSIPTDSARDGRPISPASVAICVIY